MSIWVFTSLWKYNLKTPAWIWPSQSIGHGGCWYLCLVPLLFSHWKQELSMQTLSTLVAPQVVATTTCGAASGAKVGIMTCLGFHCTLYAISRYNWPLFTETHLFFQGWAGNTRTLVVAALYSQQTQHVWARASRQGVGTREVSSGPCFNIKTVFPSKWNHICRPLWSDLVVLYHLRWEWG